MASERASRQALFGVSALLFAGSAAVTIVWSASMPAISGMSMPGGWSMSMAWMRMPGQTWPGAAASFLGMWVVMMVAMMLPSLVPMLLRYRRSVRGADGIHLHGLTAVGVGYFVIWAVVGTAAFAAGAGVMALGMRWEKVAQWLPVAAGMVLLVAGGVQFTSWKARQLALWREGPGRGCPPVPNVLGAWRHGLRLGVRCSLCCGSLMLVRLTIGMMDLVAMAAVTFAISAERLAQSRTSRAGGGRGDRRGWRADDRAGLAALPVSRLTLDVADRHAWPRVACRMRPDQEVPKARVVSAFGSRVARVLFARGAC